MNKMKLLKSALIGGASVLTLSNPAAAKIFNIPDGDLAAALSSYMQQSGVQIYFADDAVRGHRSQGAKGNYTETAALSQILRGTGFVAKAMAADAIGIVPEGPVRVAQAARRVAAAPASAMPAAVETIVVTAQKKSENIQNVPIAVTALSQQQLTARQIAAGPDLIRDVPNMNFGKTNFSGYSIELRGIGTQAISVTTDPAVAVAFNGTPFLRNHFFEQEFFDLDNVEVLRGPQGTLYGRNATAGVVNLISAKPTDEYSANISADIGNYHNRRFEGMLNIPIVGDRLAIRLAGEWTKRDGYTINENTGSPVDGRDLWSGRATLQWKPSSDLNVDLVWEHYSEDDNRIRSAKQLCHTAGVPNNSGPLDGAYYLSQGCDMNTSLYAPSAFELPNPSALPYACALTGIAAPINCSNPVYQGVTQSTNLREIQTDLNPEYLVKNDIIELNADYAVTPTLTVTSQSGFNRDSLWSTEDYNRFNTNPGFFKYPSQGNATLPDPLAGTNGIPFNAGIFCDPQLGCSDRLVAQDVSAAKSWQLSQEFRLASNFAGPLNFSFGGNYLHYETKEDYYVFINSLTSYEATISGTYVPGVTDNSACEPGGLILPTPNAPHSIGGGGGGNPCAYIDPNPIGSLNGNGHNYFRSYNPYTLNSYAAFGEAYYNITPDLKFTGGLRWTEDQKHFTDYPSELLIAGWGYPSTGVVNQQWDQLTGRSVLTWTPQLDFSDQTMVYGSYSHGYKAGGANPPGAVLLTFAVVNVASIGETPEPIHPLTFKPERVDAFEWGTKNTFLDNTLTLNADIFYYNYQNYQISRIVDRTSINDNFNAHVTGAEIESTWEPLSGLRFNAAGGWEDAEAAGNDKSVDLIDRTAGMPGWEVVKPFPTQASNCILPTYIPVNALVNACGIAYISGFDPVTHATYVPNPAGFPGYPGFNPAAAPNNGEGFDKNLGHKRLPNAPPFTLSLGGQQTVPVSADWTATLRADFYWQSDSWARIFNDNPYDRLRGYTNLNIALILSSADGWQVMGYVKNVFNTTAITGTFLNSDDSGLTTNVFLTDPRLFGVRVTKDFEAGEGNGGYGVPEFLQGLFEDSDKGKPALWIELGGGLDGIDAPQASYTPPFLAAFAGNGNHFFSPTGIQSLPHYGFESDAKVTLEIPDSEWEVSVGVRYGRAQSSRHFHQQTALPSGIGLVGYAPNFQTFKIPAYADKLQDVSFRDHESYSILDFMAGRDVGLGRFGFEGTSKFEFGFRAAQIARLSSAAIDGVPDHAFHYRTFSCCSGFEIRGVFQHWHLYSGQETAKRNFRGIGPRVAWDGSDPVLGNENSGEIDVDWGLNGALLFGHRSFRGSTTEIGRYRSNFASAAAVTYSNVRAVNRKEMGVFPNLGGFVGLSYKYSNAKVSFGYRADEFFGAMDGGTDTRKSENVGFFGPYANISIGLGG